MRSLFWFLVCILFAVFWVWAIGKATEGWPLGDPYTIEKVIK